MEMASRRWGSGARVDNVAAGKKKLLKAAITCFVSKGIQGTTIEDIANAANVTRRTVYRYYNGKNELIAAVIDLERQRLFGQLERVCEPFQNDFPRMIEECIACAAAILSVSAGSQDLLSGDNTADALPYMLSEESHDQWLQLFEDAYQQYRKHHPEVGSLTHIIELVGRLVLSFRYVPGEPDAIRAAIRAFLTLPPPIDNDFSLTRSGNA